MHRYSLRRDGTLMFALTLCWLLAGCSNESPNYQVSGSITFDGKPVPSGEVHIRPSSGNSGVGGFAVIHEGKYKSLPNRGTEGGKYELTFHGIGAAVDDFGGGADLFKPYKIEVDFPEKNYVLDIEVPVDSKQPKKP